MKRIIVHRVYFPVRFVTLEITTDTSSHSDYNIIVQLGRLASRM